MFAHLDCFDPVEIALVIDTSSSRGEKVEEDRLRRFQTFSKELVHGFSITETAGRVAIVTYSDKAKLNTDLASGTSFIAVEKSIDDIKLSDSPDRNLEEALKFTENNVFRLEGGIRKV